MRDQVQESYGANAGKYAALLGNVENLADADTSLVARWAQAIEGTVLDVGCGPGQWTHYLSGLGVTARGIDPVAEFTDLARAAYPGEQFDLGSAEDTGAADASVGGVLAWYCLIHTAPERIGDALREFRRVLVPGGGLALGFFEGRDLVPFEHAITPAWYWPMDLMVGEVEAAGFTLTHAEARTDPGARRHGAITLTCPGPSPTPARNGSTRPRRDSPRPSRHSRGPRPG